MGPCGAGGLFAVPGTLRAQSCHQPAAQGWEALSEGPPELPWPEENSGFQLPAGSRQG